MKRLTSLILSALIIFSTLTIGLSANAYDINDSYAQTLRDKGFPETYINYLVPLHNKYPSWDFIAFDTGLDWQDAVNGERTPHSKQSIQNTGSLASKYLCDCSECYSNGEYKVVEGSTWYAASEQAVAYYMDPRASLDEQYIWQFEETSYNDTQTQAGVEAIISSTWMANADITYKDSSGYEHIFYKNDSPVKYSQAIMEAAQNSDMSAYYLASKIVQEVGGREPTAGGASGTYSGYEGIYNYYNIGANTGAEDGLRWASYNPQPTGMQDIVNCDANLRSEPSTRYSNTKIGKVSAGTAAVIHNEVDGLTDGHIWFYITTTLADGSEHTGYMRSDLVTVDYAHTDYNVKMRSGPSTSTTHLTTIPKGTQVEVHRQTAVQSDGYAWYYVTANGQTGYMRSDLITIETSGTPVVDKYNRPWTNPYLSIINGAKKISESFSKYQNTGYLQKFNVNKASGNLHSHEYMANVRAASWESPKVYRANLNAGTLDTPKTFYIPVFYNMPCSTCNMNSTAVSHDVVVDKGYPATCTTDGLTDGSHCARCNEIIQKQEVINALGHDYNAVVTEPTCTQGGYTLHTCKNCGATYKDNITTKLGHKYVDTIVNPTPNEQGYTLHKCSICGDSYKDNYTDYVTDKSALISVYNSLKYLNKNDYKQTEYDNLLKIAKEYEAMINSSVPQQSIDKAVFDILEGIYSLSAFVDLKIDFTPGGEAYASYGSLVNNTDKQHSIVSGEKVVLTAKSDSGYRFVGWYEQISKRIFSTSENYEFNITSNTYIVAKFEKLETVNLEFANASGQKVETISKLASEWSQVPSIKVLEPKVPYSYGNTNGRWDYNEQDVLNKLKAGQSVVIIPKYDKVNVDNPPLPSPNGNIPTIELYNKIDSQNNVGTFIMPTGIPQGCKIDSIGLAIYYDKRENFDTKDFILTLNNKTLVSKFVELDEDGTYVVNVKKFYNDYSWSARGYITYYDEQNVLKTVYSNQINIVNGTVV